MKSVMLLATIAATLALGGCQKKGEASPSVGPLLRGRFAAVGIYDPGQMWRQLTPPKAVKPVAPANPAQANLDDDEKVLVVLDSVTGELRQCGNFSGRCIAMNPWSGPVGAATNAPAEVVKHARELQEEYERAHPETKAN